MIRPKLNLDREKGYMTLTRTFPSGEGKPVFHEVVHFTSEVEVYAYIETMMKGLQKFKETPIPSGPK